MKYIIYARKSTESEERQVLSIESQISELKEFAAKEKLEIVNVRGGAAHFCPVQSEPREARRGNSVRAILRIPRPAKRGGLAKVMLRRTAKGRQKNIQGNGTTENFKRNIQPLTNLISGCIILI